MNIPSSPRLFTFALSGLLILTGCGGGGGDAYPAEDVSSVPTSAYEPGSEELAAFDLLNAERLRCGFGTLAQNAALDAAARGHADYQIRNNLFTHEQDLLAYPQGFTGVQPVDRVLAAGYADAGAVADETVRFNGAVQKASLGTRGLRDLLSAPYHLRGLMGAYRDFGISVRASADTQSSARLVYLQINAAYQRDAGPQPQADTLVTYPCEGTNGVNRQLRNETPNPVPGRDLALNPLGTVVYLAVPEGQSLQIESASMTELQTGRNVPMRSAVSADNDPYGGCFEGCFQPNEAYVAADVPLAAFATYHVMIRGTAGGARFERAFSFTTGAGG